MRWGGLGGAWGWRGWKKDRKWREIKTEQMGLEGVVNALARHAGLCTRTRRERIFFSRWGLRLDASFGSGRVRAAEMNQQLKTNMKNKRGAEDTGSSGSFSGFAIARWEGWRRRVGAGVCDCNEEALEAPMGFRGEAPQSHKSALL